LPEVTAVIITFNEEDRIAEAVASAACCDEILVVDSESTDGTREIAARMGARVLVRKWEGYSSQKNFAAGEAVHDWILSIDADERLSIELADEITAWKKKPALAPAAYSMARRAFYLGKWINHSGWYPDRKIRLYNRQYCQWEGSFVHEWVKVNGEVGRMKGDLLHFPFRDWQECQAKIDKYTALAAAERRASGKRGNIFTLIFGPAAAFIRSFIFQAGFLDGWRGFVIAYSAARYVFLRQFRILR